MWRAELAAAAVTPAVRWDRWEKALSLLDGEGGTIVFCGNVTVSSALTVPEQSGALLWIAQDGGMLTLAVDISFAKNTNANVITLDLPVSVPAAAPRFSAALTVWFLENVFRFPARWIFLAA